MEITPVGRRANSRDWRQEQPKRASEQQGNQCGWSTISKEVGDFMRGEERYKKALNPIRQIGCIRILAFIACEVNIYHGILSRGLTRSLLHFKR